jgi:cyclase
LQNVRLIARLDIKSEKLIKGVHLEGLRVIGPPNQYALSYYHQGIDEFIFMDAVASLYGRNNLENVIMQAAENIFIPITVGGGVRSVEDALKLFRAGADKIAINTAAIDDPNLLKKLAFKFGSQSIVLSIEAKRIGSNNWEALTHNGREKTGIDAVEWAKKAVDLGIGEILLTSIDMEGTRKGFDVDLVKRVSNAVKVPVIASGGMGTVDDLIDVVRNGNVDAVAFADVIHYNRISIYDIKNHCKLCGLDVAK